MRSFRRPVALLSIPVAVAATLAGASPAPAATTAHRASSAAQAAASGGTYVPLTAARLLDARGVRGGHTTSVAVLGHGGVPKSGVSAVVLNVTAVGAAHGGVLTAYAAGSSRPTPSTLHFAAGVTVANLALVRPGSGGKVTVYNSSAGSVRVLVDVQGYYRSGAPTAGGSYAPLTPKRLADGPVGAGKSTSVPVLGHGGVPDSGVSALVVNVHAIAPAKSGYGVAYPATATRPSVSNLHFTAGRSVASLQVVKPGDDGAIRLYNGASSSTRMILDVEGYYLDGSFNTLGAFVPVRPTRLLDASGVGAGAATSTTVLGRGDVPTGQVAAVVLNVATAAPGNSGTATVYPAGRTRPSFANVHFTAGHTAANLVTLPTGSGGKVTVSNNSAGKVRLLVDVEGYYLKPPAGLTWTATTAIQPQGDLRSVSCPSATKCVAVDSYGNALTGSGDTWSLPKKVAANLAAVSCPSTTFCAAVGGEQALTYNGTSWSAPAAVDSGGNLQDISCPTTTFCAAIDVAGQVVTYDGTSWSDPSASVDISEPSSISCASATMCMTMDASGYSAQLSGTTWLPRSQVFQYYDSTNDVDCPTTTFCVAISGGDAATYDGTNWSAPSYVYYDALESISCSSAALCVALGGYDGTVWTLTDGTTWTHLDGSVGLEGTAISCPTTTYCATFGRSHNLGPADSYAGFDGAHWGTSKQIDLRVDGQLRGISCPTTSFCAAVEEGGFVTTYDGHDWSLPTLVNGKSYLYSDGLHSISCSSSTFCLAVSDEGEAVAYNGTSWSAPMTPTYYGLKAVSCANPSFCAAVDNNSHAVIYRGNGTWDPAQEIDPNTNGLASVSCPSTTMCVAVDGNGQALIYRNGSWSDPVLVDTAYSYLTSVSCTSATDCTAGDGAGNVLRYNGKTWTAPVAAASGEYLTAVACRGTAQCQAIGQGIAFPITQGVAGAQQTIDSHPYALSSLSCATPTFCVAVDQLGQAFIGR